MTLGTDNTKTSLTVNNLNKHFSTLQLVIIGNSNIVNAAFGRGGLHLNSQGFGKLAISFIKKIKNFERSWQVGGERNFLIVISLERVKYLVRKSRIVETQILTFLDHNSDPNSDPKPNLFTHNFNDLHEIMLKISNRLTFAHNNINFLRNKFQMLQEVIGNCIDVLLISEAKVV